jgi:hypothetical protein
MDGVVVAFWLHGKLLNKEGGNHPTQFEDSRQNLSMHCAYGLQQSESDLQPHSAFNTFCVFLQFLLGSESLSAYIGFCKHCVKGDPVKKY